MWVISVATSTAMQTSRKDRGLVHQLCELETILQSEVARLAINLALGRAQAQPPYPLAVIRDENPMPHIQLSFNPIKWIDRPQRFWSRDLFTLLTLEFQRSFVYERYQYLPH